MISMLSPREPHTPTRFCVPAASRFLMSLSVLAAAHAPSHHPHPAVLPQGNTLSPSTLWKVKPSVITLVFFSLRRHTRAGGSGPLRKLPG